MSEVQVTTVPSESTSTYIVRYGYTRAIGEFSTKAPREIPRHAQVVIRTERGVEWGEVLWPASEKTRQYLNSSEVAGKILRDVTAEDRQQYDQLQQNERGQFLKCDEMIKERKMQMQLVDVENLFGGERLIFYYVAEKRVDFRELVKSLAKEFRTRIEMRQIGVRDEAKLLADYGDCGKPVCCNTHLTEMPPVSMKMAKIQKATLDPTKISGRCGRLKCCLRYEYDTYLEYQRDLPEVGSTVVTKVGQGKVIAQEILARKLMVQYENSRFVLTDFSDVVTVIKKTKPQKGKPDA